MTVYNAFGAMALDASLISFAGQAYNANQDSYRVGTSKSRFKDDFFDFDIVNNWNVIQNPAGQVIAPAGAAGGARYLNINSGTNPGDETILLSRQFFRGPMKFACSVTLSQRIANQEFYIELVEVDADGNVITDATFPAPQFNDARNGAGLMWDGTVAANLKYQIRGAGISALQSASTPALTTAATGTTPDFAAAAQFEMLLQTDLAAMQARPVNSVAASTSIIARTDYVPDASALYAIRIRCKNTGTPATATDFRIHFVRIIDAARFSVDFGMIGDAKSPMLAAPVNILSAPTLTVTLSSTSVTTTPTTVSNSLRLATAGTNAVLANGASTKLFSGHVFNFTGTVLYVKLYNKATAPTVGTDLPVMTIPCEAGKLTPIPDLGPLGQTFSLGLGYAMTTNAADNDTAAVAAGSLRLNLNWK